jgi:hypothetical protein
MPLLLAMFVLWAYVCSSFVYKTWYIATAIALTALIVRRAVRVDGLWRAVAPVLFYFAWLLAGALWATFPDLVVRWVAIDSIGIAVFVLFYIAGRNASTQAIITALISLIIPTMIVATIDHVFRTTDPTATRLAPYGIVLLPLVVPFLVLRDRWPYRVAMAAAFALLVVGRNRVCLATAAVLLIISIVVLARERVVRELLLHAAVVAMTIGVLLIVPTTRTPVVAMAARYVRADVALGDVYVPAQKPDGSRPMLAKASRELLPHAMPLGIGYMNMLGYTGKSLHSMYMTFLLEGGLPCVAIVLFIAWRHARALRFASGDYAKALGIASIGILLIGLFHQVQQSPGPFMLLGLGAACRPEERKLA